MVKKYAPISSKISHMLHGADYNPEQWMHVPGMWDEDVRMMKLANCNVMALGIFSWTALEPEEGRFEFGWLDEIIDKLYENGIYVIIATPSGSRPAWMSAKYPEVLRVNEHRIRNLHGGRHNHCYTSPIYREKVRIMNTKLAQRYKDHPALIMWHISNEYGISKEFGGDCHCELCEEAFRQWLKEKYDGSLEQLNQEWWATFWSHTYTDWAQIESPAPHGECYLHGQNLDWKRFTSHQVIDFYKSEIAPLKEIAPHIPVTTNFDEYVNLNEGIDYWKFAPHVDVVSWDNYPYWHGEHPDPVEASKRAFIHDLNRSLKGGQPFMMMESSPSSTNWQPVAKLRRPGMHVLASLQAVAHGSDTVQYFQWRKSRGSSEKFHGAVVDHCGHENTRVFREVAKVGEILSKLDPIVGTSVEPDVAVIYDWENFWAIDDAQGPRKEQKDYLQTCQNHYKAFWDRGIPVDVINMDCDFSKYKLLVAPMLYMVRPGVSDRIEEFVKNGGTFVTTYWSGIVNENDLCFLEGFPGPLRKVTGIWSEELDALYDHDVNYVAFEDDNELAIQGQYEARIFCDLIHAETARVLARYKEDFYAERPALTVNDFGKGKAYYIAFRDTNEFLKDFYKKLDEKIDLKKAIATELPDGVTAQIRTDGQREFIFISNFTQDTKTVYLRDLKFIDMLTNEEVKEAVVLKSYEIKILEKK
ncbi:beta-galactosidase [Clostridiaceae bacterium 35-E11]